MCVCVICWSSIVCLFVLVLTCLSLCLCDCCGGLFVCVHIDRSTVVCLFVLIWKIYCAHVFVYVCVCLCRQVYQRPGHLDVVYVAPCGRKLVRDITIMCYWGL